MKVLLLGSTESLYLEELPRRLVSLGWSIDLIDPGKTSVSRFRRDGSHRTIDYSTVHIAVRHLRAVIRFMALLIFLYRKLPRYDNCQIHFISTYLGLVPRFVWKRCASVSLHFWGSDLLRTGRLTKFLQRHLVRASSAYVFNNSELKDIFEAQFRRYRPHSSYIVRFPLPGFSEVMEFCQSVSPGEAKRMLDLPTDRTTLCIGYNGRREQQHVAVLDALRELPAAHLARLTILIPITYGCEDSYANEIEENVRLLGCEYKVYRDRMSRRTVAALRRATDILVHVQTTDSFSGSVQEVMYCGGIVVNGAWLPYRQIAALGLWWLDVQTIMDIPAVVVRILEEYQELKQRAAANEPIVQRLGSWEGVREDWSSLGTKIVHRGLS